ncbi:SigE family RNA polymerase sigma factor [Blastococcus sp. TF02A-26]|uniref:SigE family RNA polymerase sigma factor n=1 Tax=Blastococcus sp. TF02A-26 TaxID=2250577 RepID=UPI000DEAB77C|nr:SigE family RNA polymerase sigma factor [Blastococcus sp. TF02A-26]RBY81018.1 SigE family RNA polymerase sigma factor [Blastococcus sp. TF02A-26]
MREDDDGAFADFVSREQPALLRLAVLLAGDRGHAEDLLQTALIKAYRHWPRISAAGTPTAYVRRVLVTSHTSWRRRLSTTEQVVETFPDRADEAAGPGDPDEELRAALRSLPPRMRTAVVLRYYADLSLQQTAEAMGCSASAVDTQTSRGLARLRAALAAPEPAAATAGTPEERS